MDDIYYDLNKKCKSKDINLLMEDWQDSEETIVVYAPHDDDFILGTGYLLSALLKLGAECYVFIFCNGCAGYSDIEQKDKIVELRREETKNAYQKLGIEEENIVRFDFPDFSANTKIGWQLPDGENGSFYRTIHKLREVKATRLLIPNGYREHIDHRAVNKMGLFDAPQAGDPVLVDWGEPTEIKTVMEYSVWGDFSPEDALINDRSMEIRANCAIGVNQSVEGKIREAIREYQSQSQIIQGIIKKREERKLNGRYLEVYRKIDPRPSLKYEPYKKYIKEI